MEVLKAKPGTSRTVRVVKKDALTLRIDPGLVGRAHRSLSSSGSGDLTHGPRGPEQSYQAISRASETVIVEQSVGQAASRPNSGRPLAVDTWEDLIEVEEIPLTRTAVLEKTEVEEDTFKALDAPQWEEPSHDLAEHRPCVSMPLIAINLTKLLSDEAVDDESIELVKERVEQVLAENFKTAIGEMFDLGSLSLLDSSCTYLRMSSVIATILGIALHTEQDGLEEFLLGASIATPDDKYHVVSYPERIGEEQVAELWRRVTSPTPWKSVNSLKTMLRHTSKDLIWKAEVAAEVEKMAMKEEMAQNARQRDAQLAIDQLIRLRDSLLERIEREGSGDQTKIDKMRERLVIVEEDLLEKAQQRIGELEDLFSQGWEDMESGDEENMLSVQQRLINEALDKGNKGNLLDLLVAMILQQYPRNPLQSEREHFVSMAKLHLGLRFEWQKEFGTLPMGTGYIDDSPNEENPSTPSHPSSAPALNNDIESYTHGQRKETPMSSIEAVEGLEGTQPEAPTRRTPSKWNKRNSVRRKARIRGKEESSGGYEGDEDLDVSTEEEVEEEKGDDVSIGDIERYKTEERPSVKGEERVGEEVEYDTELRHRERRHRATANPEQMESRNRPEEECEEETAIGLCFAKTGGIAALAQLKESEPTSRLW